MEAELRDIGDHTDHKLGKFYVYPWFYPEPLKYFHPRENWECKSVTRDIFRSLGVQ